MAWSGPSDAPRAQVPFENLDQHAHAAGSKPDYSAVVRRSFAHTSSINTESTSMPCRARMLSIPCIQPPLDVAAVVSDLSSRTDALSKIIDQGRGGFCYEINLAFAWLLRSLGYTVNTLHTASSTAVL